MKDKKKFHEIALKRFDAAYTPQTGIRESIRMAIRFARKNGAQWEGRTAAGWSPKETMKERPMLEVNRCINSVERITAEGKNSRISVKFRPADNDASEKLAESLNGKFRADFNGCEGEEASDTAYEDGVAGGMGCVRLCTVPEDDDEDPEGQERKRIATEYVPESYGVVWFDPAAKRYDKSDGFFAFENFSMSPDTYKEKYKKDPADLTKGTGIQFDWFSADLVYVARYYERRLDAVNLITYENALTGHTAVYDEDHIEKVADELARVGYHKVSEAVKKRYRIYCSVIDGDGILEEPVLLPGTLIPLVPYYGKRFYSEGKEQVEGFTQKAMDAQVMLNVGVSMLAKEAIEANSGQLAVNEKFIRGFEHIWGNPSDKAFLPTHDAPAAPSGAGPQKDAPPPVMQLQPTTLSQAISQLIATANDALMQLTGNAVSEQPVPGGVSGKTINAMTGRTDQQDYNFIDNLKKSTRHLGRVWLSMSRDLYGSDHVVRIVKPNGDDELITLSEEVMDSKTGEFIGLNDISQGKYDVTVSIGPAFATARQQAIESLTAILKDLPLSQEVQQELAMSIIDMIAGGEGLDNVKRVIDNQLLLSGLREPETPEEQKKLQAYQQQQQQAAQNNPTNILAQSQAMKARADMFKSVSQLIDSGVNVFDTEADIQLKGSQMLKNMSDIDYTRAQTASSILGMLNSQQESLINTQLHFLGGMNDGR
ncbi:portal protein [Lelliottia wanjuensis]|uniref:Portal protein n=1 Tax=Lelliottia wanjuensis TaxID=3050585 RepID=A0AAP4D5F3_9ENTR|nr:MULTISPECIES: portal protein [unclassified Lelliottia]MDK9364178.1 portal protein [Lelliottia sp. V106_12]MDK9617145.1 portal protein [Lelliottia sp. V106_9]